jgi:hypothetical protein
MVQAGARKDREIEPVEYLSLRDRLRVDVIARTGHHCQGRLTIGFRGSDHMASADKNAGAYRKCRSIHC